MSQPSIERDSTVTAYPTGEFGSTLGEVVENHNALLSSAVASYNTVVSGHANAYRSHVTLISTADAPVLLDGMSRVVDNTVLQAYTDINSLIERGAQELELMISTHDAGVLDNLRTIAADNTRGIDSTAYGQELARATPGGRDALGKIMDRDWSRQSQTQALDPRVGLGPQVNRTINNATPAARPAIKASLDIIALHQSQIFAQNPRVGLGPQVNRTINNATPAARPAIKASLDIIALHQGRVENGSNEQVRDLIGAYMSYAGLRPVQPVAPPTPRRDPGMVRQESRRTRRWLQAATALGSAAAITIFAISMRGHVFADDNPGYGALTKGPLAAGPITPGAINQCYSTAPNVGWPTATPSTIQVPTANGATVARAYPSESFANRVTDDLVEVTASPGENGHGWKGSGIITTDPEGNEVVLTAAHVTEELPLDEMTITTSDGQQVQPIGGCIIWANGGELYSSAAENHPLDTDIAVLELPRALVTDPMPLATSDPKPGTLVTFDNYQQHYGPPNSLVGSDTKISAASYNGIVAPSSQGDPTLNVITGLDTNYANPTSDQFEMSHIMPGASGGPLVVDVDGVPELDGITDSNDVTLGNTTANGNGYLTDGDLGQHNIIFPDMTAGSGGFFPVDARAMRLRTIRLALGAPILATQSAN